MAAEDGQAEEAAQEQAPEEPHQEAEPVEAAPPMEAGPPMEPAMEGDDEDEDKPSVKAEEDEGMEGIEPLPSDDAPQESLTAAVKTEGEGPADPLATLASAAISSSGGTSTEGQSSAEGAQGGDKAEGEAGGEEEEEEGEEKGEKKGKKDPANQWYDVGIIKSTSTIVAHYHLPSEAGAAQGTNGADISVSLSLNHCHCQVYR